MERIVRLLPVIFGLLLSTGAIAQTSLDEGRKLYKSGKYAEAAAKLEQAAKEDPKDAQAWWQLNFAYHKLNRDADSLKAVQKAGEADPSHGFASDPAKYAQILADRQRSAGTAATGQAAGTGQPSSGRTGPTSSGSGSGNLTQQLVNGDVYVQPGINVDVERLRQVTRELRPTVVKIVVFNSRSNSRTLSSEADKVRRFLKSEINQGHGYVIAASRSAVAVSSDSINRNDLKQLTDQVAPSMAAGDYTGGLERLARGLVKERARTEAPVSVTLGGIPTVQHGPNWMLIFLGITAVVVVIWLIARSAANSRAMGARKEPLERLRSEVISQMNYLDDSLTMASAAAQPGIRAARVAAGSKLDEASRIMAHAKSDQELMRAQNLLDQAQADVARGRAVLEAPAGAVAGAGAAVSTSSPPAVQTSAQTDWSSVPQDDKGVCFFCSRPSLLSELTPVTVNLDGQQQKVLACPTDLATVRSGQTPQIRAFQEGSRYVPWYAYQNYDPYRDYYSRGYGGGSLLTDMIMFSAIDNMFWNWHHPMGWGWGGYGGYGGGNTYVFYGDHPQYQDYYSHHAASSGDFDSTPADAGGTDFLDSTGGDLGGGAGSTIGSDHS